MSIIGVGLYVNDSRKAVETYLKAFGAELGYHVLNDDGTYFHSELYKDGVEMLCVVQTNEQVSGANPVQLGYTFENREKLLEAFEILKENGTVRMDVCELPWSPCAAEVTDEFGVRWYLTVPQHRPPDTFTPNDCK